MSVKQAFATIISLSGRDIAITRKSSGGDASVIIKGAPSNYFRQLVSIEEMTIETTEIVISKDSLGVFGKPKKGDLLVDSEYGRLTIDQIIEMSFFGEVIGYRLRFR